MVEISRRALGTVAAGVALGSTLPEASAKASQCSSIAELYDRSDATDLAQHVRRGLVSADELLSEAIQRADSWNPVLNAVTLRHDEMARKAAAEKRDGPLAGVPFLLKDLGAQLAGTPTTGGSRSLFGVNSPADSELVKRYKAAGLNIFGKTNVPEFGMAFTTESTAYGPCRNPWDVSRTPAGSSGGAAAAVAAGIVPVAHGSDGGGSIRVPAAACGVYGFKPTRLRTPRGPGTALSPSSMSVEHVLSRSVRDSALLLDLTAGYEPGAPYAAPGPNDGFLSATQRTPGQFRIAMNLSEPVVKLQPECREAVLRTAQRLESLGHFVEEARPDINQEAINKAQTYLVMAEFSLGMHGLAKFLGKPVSKIGLEPLSLEIVYEGSKVSAHDYISHCRATYAGGASIARLQSKYDLILESVTATLPPKLGVLNYQPDDTPFSFIDRFRRYASYTYLYNLTGQPSASIPCGLAANGLPTACMLTGRNGEDAMVLAVSAQLEAVAPWFGLRPPMPVVSS